MQSILSFGSQEYSVVQEFDAVTHHHTSKKYKTEAECESACSAGETCTHPFANLATMNDTLELDVSWRSSVQFECIPLWCSNSSIFLSSHHFFLCSCSSKHQVGASHGWVRMLAFCLSRYTRRTPGGVQNLVLKLTSAIHIPSCQHPFLQMPTAVYSGRGTKSRTTASSQAAKRGQGVATRALFPGVVLRRCLVAHLHLAHHLHTHPCRQQDTPRFGQRRARTRICR